MSPAHRQGELRPMARHPAPAIPVARNPNRAVRRIGGRRIIHRGRCVYDRRRRIVIRCGRDPDPNASSPPGMGRCGKSPHENERHQCGSKERDRTELVDHRCLPEQVYPPSRSSRRKPFPLAKFWRAAAGQRDANGCEKCVQVRANHAPIRGCNLFNDQLTRQSLFSPVRYRRDHLWFAIMIRLHTNLSYLTARPSPGCAVLFSAAAIRTAPASASRPPSIQTAPPA
jgi:hypothetical protein